MHSPDLPHSQVLTEWHPSTGLLPGALSRTVLLLLALLGAAAPVSALAPLLDPVALNIGLACQWQPICTAGQRRAMTKSLKYVAKYHPPQWRVQLCNRNAARFGNRVDWIGFDHCVRNEALRPPPPPPPPPRKATKRKKRHR